ncbi:O-antigen ligase [Falsiroseomonas sp.]|uniref:O-antigen ligase family protein n=1 Tax=Falsiroseomonas sp. TaxID=2870721 RepID=UPI002732D93F|nr:O-antigen ligase family protein [Falsiroseomonas sp.]MDP3418339.1 O-antigen ligase family protein [Falsiroseomonas sp.]
MSQPTPLPLSGPMLGQALRAGARGAVHRSLADRYFMALAVSLCGYAIFGKGFAYLGLAPLYIGEILLGLGVLVLLFSGCLLGTLTNLTNLLLTALCLWVVIRMVPFIGIHGIDALRDSVLVLYGAFAFVACGLLLQRPSRLPLTLGLFGTFALIYGAYGWVPYALAQIPQLVPAWPGSGLPLVLLRPGEVAVHLAGTTVFALLFFRRVNWLWLLLLLVAIGLTAGQSRGGMLAIALPVGCAILVSGKTLDALKALGVVLVLVGAASSLAGGLEIGSSSRGLSLEQIMLNALSIFKDTSEAGLDGTKMWRLRWWQDILGYTVHGPHFWTGKGFGISLAESDGYQGTIVPGTPILRSPHNAHLTILARAGVPGIVLWVAMLVSWFAMMASSMLLARRRGEQGWFRLFLFLACYLASILVNASFDVALEGPMLGIWFWVLLGLGSGSSMIYRAQSVGGPPPMPRRILQRRPANRDGLKQPN